MPGENTVEDLIDKAVEAKHPKLPAEQRDTLVTKSTQFHGYKGRSENKSRTRLYLTLQRDEYIEVWNEFIEVEVSLSGDESPHVILLIKPDSDIKYVSSRTENMPAEFLAGSIALRHLGGSGASSNPTFGPNGMAFGQTARSGSWARDCGSWARDCGSWISACP